MSLQLEPTEPGERYGPLVKFTPAASAAHALFHQRESHVMRVASTLDAADATGQALAGAARMAAEKEFIQVVFDEHRAEIGGATIHIDCDGDGYQIVLPPAPPEPPDWAVKLRAEMESGNTEATP